MLVRAQLAGFVGDCEHCPTSPIGASMYSRASLHHVTSAHLETLQAACSVSLSCCSWWSNFSAWPVHRHINWQVEISWNLAVWMKRFHPWGWKVHSQRLLIWWISIYSISNCSHWPPHWRPLLWVVVFNEISNQFSSWLPVPCAAPGNESSQVCTALAWPAETLSLKTSRKTRPLLLRPACFEVGALVRNLLLIISNIILKQPIVNHVTEWSHRPRSWARSQLRSYLQAQVVFVYLTAATCILDLHFFWIVKHFGSVNKQT